MRKGFVIAAAVAIMLSSPAGAQDAGGLLGVYQAQRNLAWDAHAQAINRANAFEQELTRLKAELEELKKKLPPEPVAPTPKPN